MESRHHVNARHNIFVTIRSPNGTEISGHLPNDCTVPTNAASFWELVEFQDVPKMDGKVSIRTNGGNWEPLVGTAPQDENAYGESEGAFYFQIERPSTPSNSPTASSPRKMFSRNPFESRIPSCYIDETITKLAGFFKDILVLSTKTPKPLRPLPFFAATLQRQQQPKPRRGNTPKLWWIPAAT